MTLYKSMKQKLLILLLFSLCTVLNAQEEQSLKTYPDFDSFEQEVLQRDDGYTYVVNFWATWCAPCVKELPYFYDIEHRFKDEKVKVILVSLDFKRQIESKLKPFIKKHNIQNEVVVLLDGNSTAWIDRIDTNWSGAIPYTKVYKGSKSIGAERSFHSTEEIDNFIKSL